MNDLNNKYDIQDNDIRILGQNEQSATAPETKKKRLWPWIVAAMLICALILTMYLWINGRPNQKESVYRDIPHTCDTLNSKTTIEELVPTDANAHVTVSQQTVDDVPLRLLHPSGGHIELFVGALDTTDASIIMAARAADYRADNGKIAGAFVYKGELLSRGHPKLGFCAIIGHEVTMGMSPETPLFERAVEQEGYFFRQHSLVHNGELGEKTPPGKSVRRALCYDGKNLFVVDTEERESLHDFAQALLDMGVQEAISLMGRCPLSLYEDEEGKRWVMGMPVEDDITETHIVWRR